MKSKGHDDTIRFRTVYDHYRRYSGDTLDDIYERYISDDDRIKNINGKTFYRAAIITEITIRDEKKLEVALPFKVKPESKNYIDAFGNIYELQGIEMMSFRGEFPKWHNNIQFVILSYPDGKISENFAPV